MKIISLFVLLAFSSYYAEIKASSKSFLLQTYLNRVDELIQSHQFSEAKRCLVLLEALFLNNAEVQEKSKELVIKDYQETYIKNIELSEQELGWTGDIKKCKAGTVSKTAISKCLSIINYFRRQAGLYDQCVFVDSFNIYCQQTAFVLYVNDILTHYIENSAKCYTEMAKEGARKSNLSYGIFGPAAIQSQIFDNGYSNTDVGHRRWILNPFNTKFGIGITPQTTALGVLGKFAEWNETGNKEYYEGKQYVTWPPAGYFPKNLVPHRWSFSLHRGSFEDAKVTVYMYKNGKKTLVDIERKLTQNGYALNTVVWEPKNEWDVGNETVFEVEIKNVYLKTAFGVTRKDQPLNFSYKVTLLEI